MSLTEINKIDKIEILEKGIIQIRYANIIEKDGVEIAKTYHRTTICPDDNIIEQDSKVQSIANLIWTDEIINEYNETKKANEQ